MVTRLSEISKLRPLMFSHHDKGDRAARGINLSCPSAIFLGLPAIDADFDFHKALFYSQWLS
jgi:hypothetical protein